jgi:hypothetical protein
MLLNSRIILFWQVLSKVVQMQVHTPYTLKLLIANIKVIISQEEIH